VGWAVRELGAGSDRPVGDFDFGSL
jgi:hypothetical protein